MNDLPDHLVQRAQQLAHDLLARIDDTHAGVVVATEDGFDVAHSHAPRVQFDPGRLAAMASSIAAIGDVVGRETGMGRTECLVAETQDGYVVLRSAAHGPHRVVLAAMASRQSTLGLLMHAVSAAAREFAR